MGDGPSRRRESPAAARERRAAVDDPAIVLAAAARFLEARPRATAEVRRRLGSAGYRPDLIEAAVDRLTDIGYLDDEAFARAWVESRDRARPRGERAIRDELVAKGVERSIIDAVLEERRNAGSGVGDDTAPPADDARKGADERAAERLLARHTRSLARIADPRVRRQRAYGLLARNGFDPDVCARVAGQVGEVGPDRT